MEKKHISLWLDEELLKECDEMMKDGSAKNRSEYFETALKFYNDYQKGKEYRSCACEKLKTINLSDYPLSQLQDLAQYLFDEKVIFSDYSEVNEYFSKKIK